jgi:hypothetical protein
MKEIEKVHLAVSCSDGSVVFMEFVTNDHRRIRQKPTKKNIDPVIAQSSLAWPPSYLPIVGWQIINESDIPKDRTYRRALTIKDGGITVDMPKAREIHRQNMRIERAPLLAALDVDYQRADESSNKELKASIASQKQALRDVTKLAAIDEAQTPDELKQVWPEALKR